MSTSTGVPDLRPRAVHPAPAGTGTPGDHGEAPSHEVVFYDDDPVLHGSVGQRVIACLRGPDTVVVVVTAAHRDGLASVLRAGGVDLDQVREAGRYVEIDAAALLDAVATDAGPDPQALDSLAAAHEASARRRGGRLLVVSELAPLLWERGLVVAALGLEAVAADLVARHGLDMVCAYPTGAFPEDAHSHGVGQVCAAHTDHLPATGAGAALDRVLWGEVALRDQVIDAVDAAVVVTDLDGTVQLWNHGARLLHGWSAEQAVGRHVVEVTLPVEHRGAGFRHWDTLQVEGAWEGQMDAERPDGSTVPVHVRTQVLRGPDGAPTAIVGVAVDQTVQREREQHLVRRNAWLRRVTDLMGEGLATLDAQGRMTMLNPHGEQLLGVPHRTAVGGSFTNRLLPLRPDGSVTPVSEAMIGAAFSGTLPDTPIEARVLRPDGTTIPIEYVATRIPSNEGADTHWVVVFRDIADRLEHERELRTEAHHARWMARIRDALDHERFVLHAQPIVDLRTGQVVQRELLIRLDDPVEGLVAPGAFMPTAERYGLAPAIDRWVVHQAVQLAATGLPVEVNLSARSFADPSLPHLIEQLVQESGADPRLLAFELTETALLDNEHDAARFAARIHALGARLALDDFGTGYGAFIHLKHMPVDVLKIDIEFVRDVTTSPASRHVVEAVVTLARSLGIQTIAEGVEDQATLELLTELGVDQAQGYHLGRPAPLPAAHA